MKVKWIGGEWQCWYFWLAPCPLFLRLGNLQKWAVLTQPAIPYSKWTIKILEQGVKIFSKLTIKTSERHRWLLSGVFIVNFKHISQSVLVFLSLALDRCRLRNALIPSIITSLLNKKFGNDCFFYSFKLLIYVTCFCMCVYVYLYVYVCVCSFRVD